MTLQNREKIITSKSFYRDHYRSSLQKLLYVIAFMILLIAIVLYEALHIPSPKYYATSSDGSLIPLAVIVPAVIKSK